MEPTPESQIQSESLRSKRRKELIAEFLSISTLILVPTEELDFSGVSIEELDWTAKKFNDSFNTSTAERENTANLLKQLKERMLKILESIPEGHSQDLQINAIFNEIHRLGLSERLFQTLEEEKRRINKEVESDFQKSFSGKYSESEMADRVSELRRICYDITSPETSEKIKNDFPSGNFLFHGTSVKGMIGVIESGELANFKKLHEAEIKKAEEEGRKPELLRRNSGYEGISWSFNAVDALPGTRYHLAGFLTSPETALESDTQLVIPSRPAPFELLQISHEIDYKRFYELKIQDEIYGPGNGLSDSSVIANLIFYEMSIKGKMSSVVLDFIKKEQDITELTKTLRNNYTKRENGTIEFSKELSQQKGEVIPPLLVWFQAIIDSGRISEIEGFENCQNVYEVLERINNENYKLFFKELRKDCQHIQKEIKEDEEKITSLEIDVTEMYLVVPEEDLENYLKLFAVTGKSPKGILVYDSSKVSLENFASKFKGDQEEFTTLLRNVVPQGEGVIDYEDEILGAEINSENRAGYVGQVIRESVLGNRRALVKNQDGSLVIE